MAVRSALEFTKRSAATSRRKPPRKNNEVWSVPAAPHISAGTISVKRAAGLVIRVVSVALVTIGSFLYVSEASVRNAVLRLELLDDLRLEPKRQS